MGLESLESLEPTGHVGQGDTQRARLGGPPTHLVLVLLAEVEVLREDSRTAFCSHKGKSSLRVFLCY